MRMESTDTLVEEANAKFEQKVKENEDLKVCKELKSDFLWNDHYYYFGLGREKQ